MEMAFRPVLYALLVIVAVATVEGKAQEVNAELVELRAAQHTVQQAQKDLDAVDDDSHGMDVEEAVEGHPAEAKAAKKKNHPFLGEADDLMKADDKLGNPTVDTDAAVEAEAMNNGVLGEGEAEGEDAAKPGDVKKAFDLAKNLKSTDLLPEGWIEKHDADTGKPYYENTLTKTTTWDPPKSLVGIAMEAAKGQLRAEAELKEMKMRMSQQDLGESADTSVSAKCPKKLKEILGKANKLKGMVRDLAAKLNLTTEQQKILDNLMKGVILPAVGMAPKKPAAAKPGVKKKAAAKKKGPAAKNPPTNKKTAGAAKKPLPSKKSSAATKGKQDLGESASVTKPVTLAEEEALEAQDDRVSEEMAAKAVKAEAARVASDFHTKQEADEKSIQKMSEAAGKAIEDKMAKEDAALLKSDKETESSVRDIIGDQKQYEAEQGLLQGTMTPEQVEKMVETKNAAQGEADPDFDSVAKPNAPPPKPVREDFAEYDELEF